MRAGLELRRLFAYAGIKLAQGRGFYFYAKLAITKEQVDAFLAAAEASCGSVAAVLEQWRCFIIALVRVLGICHPGYTDEDLAEDPYATNEFCVRARTLRAAVVADARSRRVTFDAALSVPPLVAAIVSVLIFDEFEHIKLFHNVSAELKADRSALVAEVARRSAFSLWEIASGRAPPIYHPSGVLHPARIPGGRRGAAAAPTTDEDDEADSLDEYATDDDDDGDAPAGTVSLAALTAALGANPAAGATGDTPWYMCQPSTFDAPWATQMDGDAGRRCASTCRPPS